MRKFKDRKPNKRTTIISKENATIIRAINNYGRVPEQHELLDEIDNLQQENKQLKEKIETILDFDYFKNECPLNIVFADELESKAQDVFYEDEYCESCKDDYKTCWLKYFKKLQELKEKYK